MAASVAAAAAAAAAAMAYVSSPVQPLYFLLRSLPCFSTGTIPQFIDEEEDGWREFNASMHDRYGYNKLPDFPLKIVTKTDLRSSKIFITRLDERCQRMIKIWINLLAPLVKSEDDYMRLLSALTVSWLMSMILFFFIYKIDT